MEPRIDEMVLKVQQWLNLTYGDDSRFNRVEETGRTGWPTIYGLRRALQIELGITNTSNSFGPTTYSLCPNVNQGEEGNIVYIIQGGLWCKGYSPGGFTGYYGNGTYAAVKALKADMGFPTASGNMNRDIMRGLLDMSAFVCVSGGTEAIRSIQQQLNYDYYDYYQVCPCDGLYNREMNKMLIYALQKELGIAKGTATGTWGPTTISLCKAKSFNIGNSSPIVKLIRYATVCNGFLVNTQSATYDNELDNTLSKFADYLKIPKQSNKVDYTVIKSLLSSNGDTDRSAIGCDTATKLTIEQIQTLKNAGYKYVGRYLTNTPGGTLDKCLTRTEIENILNAGLKIFAIFQESGNGVDSFTASKGLSDAERAFEAAEILGIPHASTIYFAVDFDPTDAEISSNIIKYFRAILTTNIDKKYKVGVYGTRNVCQRLNNELGINRFFVSNSSYGFSGNLGFTMPQNWCYDQFCTDITIGTGLGMVSIDKVAVSSQDKGIGYICTNVANVVIDYVKCFGLEDKLDLNVNFEKDLVQVLKPILGGDGNYITLTLTHGVNLNPDSGITFSTDKEISVTTAEYMNDSMFDALDYTTKMNIIGSLNSIGYSVETGNLEVKIMTVSDKDNSGILVSYDLTVPIFSDGSAYVKISLLFKYKGEITLDFATLEIDPIEARRFGALLFALGTVVILGPTVATIVAESVGVTSATNLTMIAAITESVRTVFGMAGS